MEYSTTFEGDCFKVNGNAYRVLFIPYMENITLEFSKILTGNDDCRFVFIGGYPKGILGKINKYEKDDILKKSL